MEPVRLTREELYEQVWSTPMRTLAKRYNMSDRGLAKLCERHRIPAPERGYWAKKAAGHAVRPAPLPAIPTNSPDLVNVVIWATGSEPKLTPSAPVAAQVAFEAEPKNHIRVPETLRSAHPLVRQTHDVLRGSAKRDDEYVGNWQVRHLDVEVSRGTLNRALRILDAVIKAFEVRGWKVTLGGEQDRKSYVMVDGQRVPFGIREKIRKVQNEPAKPERLFDGSWYTPYRSKYRDEASGILSLIVRYPFSGSARVERSWDETSSHPLEERLNDYIIGVVEYADYWREWERQRQENERARVEEQRKQAEAARLRELELAKIRRLEQQAESWTKGQQIAAFVEAVRQRAIVNPDVSNSESLAAWLAWAMAHATALDSIAAILSAFTPKREGSVPTSNA